LQLPYLNVHLNKQVINQIEVAKKLSKLVSNELNKPEKFVMVSIESDICICFNGTEELTVFMELKSIGFPEDIKKISKSLCNFMKKEFNINKDRVYIVFSDVNRKMWSWNGETF